MSLANVTEYTEDPTYKQKQAWKLLQENLKTQIILDDQLDFDSNTFEGLKYIGGVDLSFLEDDQEKAIACLVVMTFPALEVVYTEFLETRLYLPYIAGFLAFREVEPLQTLLEQLKSKQPEIYPQVLFVDGNGRLHPRTCGIACHLGVVADIPTIGIGKNFLVINDGPELQMHHVKKEAKKSLLKKGDVHYLKGQSGIIYGGAVRTTDSAPNPIFVSQGHRISLETCIKLVLATCHFRIPDPIRRADQDSRAYIRSIKK